MKYLLVSMLQGTWWALVLLLPLVRPFYVPGVAPRDFHDGDTVDIKVRLKFTKNQYYDMFFQ